MYQEASSLERPLDASTSAGGFDAMLMPAEISALIRRKERELHDIHEHRCTQLEKLIEAKQASLDEGNRKFSQLKEDFKYNLSLLDARDAEIRRLEGCCNELQLEVQALREEKSALAQRVERWQAKDAERREKSKSDAAMHKKMLLEVQEELEAARWSMGEELAARQREVEASREEARRAWQQREEALETQRRELTAAFEKLMKQNDDACLEREAKIASQIGSLEQRIESVQNTNASLRSELAAASRARDQAAAELERREETIRQLNWRFEDALGSWKRAEDALERRVAQAVAEADASRDSMIRQIQDAHHEIEKNRLEVARERDLRSVVEEKCKALRREMADERVHLEAARREALTERSRAEAAHAAEISSLQQKLLDVQNEIDLHKTAIEATHVTQAEEMEGRYLRQIKEWEKKYGDCAAERDHLLQSSKSLRSELEEQRTEAGALRLRLELQDANLTQLQKQLQQQQLLSNMKNDFAKAQTPLASNFRDGNPLEVSLDSAHSPMFSDDFGPASLPLSPGGFGLSPQRPAVTTATRPGAARPDTGAAASLNAMHELSVRDQEISRLRDENRNLRDAIHDMRNDIEKLQLDASKEGDSAILQQKNEVIARQASRISDLEGQLAAAAQEASRLRGERKRLMEVGNELRAALFEYQIKYGDSAEDIAMMGGVAPPPPPGPGAEPAGGEEEQEDGEERAPAVGAGASRRPNLWTPAQRAVVRMNAKSVSIAPPGDALRPQYAAGPSNLVEVEGERVSLAPLPLPPRSAGGGGAAADRTTDSQRRALDRLRQQHLRSRAAASAAYQPRKVMNYSVPPPSAGHDH